MSATDFLAKLMGGAEVAWKPLGEVGSLYGGLTGKSKSDFQDGNAKFVSYKNIFGNPHIDTAAFETVKVSAGERQNAIRYGDILFTGSSERADEAGLSSAVTSILEENVYLNSFSFGLRLNDGVCLSPEFLKYLFRATFMRSSIAKTASGVTRFNISKDRFKKILIPIPCPDDPEKSLAIQKEIVRMLDSFTELIADLTSTLTARKTQYHYYRDRIISGQAGEVEWRTLEQIGEFIRGKRFTKADYVDEGISAIHYGEIYTHYGLFAQQTLSKVRSDMASSLRYAEPNDVVIAGVSETIEDVGKAVAWLGKEKVAIHDDSYAFRHHMNPKFIAYAMQTDAFHDQKAKYVSSGKIKRLLIDGVKNVRLPVPHPNDPRKSLEEQARIVAILDKFDTLTTSRIEGLPREIELRETQYAYYRDLLLSFPKPDQMAA